MEKLARETLESCREYTPKLIAASEQITNFFLNGADQEGLDLLPQVFDGLNWLFEAVYQIQKQGLEVGIKPETLRNYFDELENALVVKDYNLISELFSYEIKPQLERWLKQMNSFQIH